MSLFSTIKIVDLSRVFSGPFATLQFANFKAEVIKIEVPDGDESRYFPPVVDNWSGYFELLNHNKTSLVLNLKDEAERQKLYDLCREADVVVENFSPDVKRRLKIDYETLKKYNSQLIYASISGVSEAVNKKYYDIIAQAESGFISLNGKTEDVKVSTSVIDAFTGMKLAFAIAGALYARTQTGQGTKISVSMKGSAFDLLEQNLIETSISKNNPHKAGDMDTAIAPFGLFQAQDRKIALAVGNEKLWSKLEDFLLQEDPEFPSQKFGSNLLRLENLPELQSRIELVFKNYAAQELVEKLSQIGIPCGKVNTMLDVLKDQENYDQGLLQEVQNQAGAMVIPTGGIFFSAYPQEEYKPAPAHKNENA